MAEDLITNIRAEASRIEEDTIHSGKGHLAAATRWRSVHYRLGVPATVCSALAALSVVTAHQIVAATLAIVAAILTSLITFLKPEARASSHTTSGNRYLGINARARMFRTIDMLTGDDPKALRDAVKQLAEERAQLNETSEQIPPAAYEQAKKGIAAGEAAHAVDEKRRQRKTPPPVQ